jgi:endo-1,4-beta-mannosidase
MIDQMFCEMVGPDFTAEFWKMFKDNYVTREDIEFIASTGANTIRVPFHYKLFTDEDYMGLKSDQDGFKRLDDVIGWCREFGLYVILDMHDAPGGQTGDNIDDSYGYPWLFESEESQLLFCDIWRRIAEYYRNEPVILGYDLINEPIAPYFDNMDELNKLLEPLHKRVTAVIREVDPNHIIMLGAPQWNGNFSPFTDWTYDDNIMYTCHRYGGDASVAAIGNFIEFKAKTNLPMYMGEIGHNTDEWQEAFCIAMEQSNIGYTFWPYKKIHNSCFAGIVPPENWRKVIAFSEAPRSTYFEVRAARPDQAVARKAMIDFIEASRLENCVPQDGYINSLRLK